jgi:hypothetical protein
MNIKFSLIRPFRFGSRIRQAQMVDRYSAMQWACYREISCGFFRIGFLSYKASKKYYARVGEHSNLSYLEFSKGIDKGWKMCHSV